MKTDRTIDKETAIKPYKDEYCGFIDYVCGMCDKSIKLDFNYCPHCGYKIKK